jgi:hypothetical protein
MNIQTALTRLKPDATNFVKAVEIAGSLLDEAPPLCLLEMSRNMRSLALAKSVLARV